MCAAAAACVGIRVRSVYMCALKRECEVYCACVCGLGACVRVCVRMLV